LPTREPPGGEPGSAAAAAKALRTREVAGPERPSSPRRTRHHAEFSRHHDADVAIASTGGGERVLGDPRDARIWIGAAASGQIRTGSSVVSTPPSHSDFTATVREAFSFLGRFGFQEVTAPPNRATDPFEIWFGAGDRFVVVSGEGYGTMTSVTLEHDGRECSESFFMPPHERRPAATRRKPPPGQLEQVREAAERLERWGVDFLTGDVSRFNLKAKPLPPYKRRSD
jgi:hypothetical protein